MLDSSQFSCNYFGFLYTSASANEAAMVAKCRFKGFLWEVCGILYLKGTDSDSFVSRFLRDSGKH